jgi:hypothetical protein
MLLDWYQVSVDVSGIAGDALGILAHLSLPSEKVSAWEAFDSEDIALVIVSNLTLAAVALSAFRASRFWLILGAAGSLALVVILFIEAASPPELVTGLVDSLSERLNQVIPGGLPDVSIPDNPALNISTDTKALAGPWIAFGAALIAFGGCAMALLAGPAGRPTRRCPDCARLVSSQANVCRFCGHRFDDTPVA